MPHLFLCHHARAALPFILPCTSLCGGLPLPCCTDLQPLCAPSCNRLCMQRLVNRRTAAHTLVAACYVLSGFCLVLGYLGALQSIPSVAVMTRAVIHSGGALLELSIMVIVMMLLSALLLYNSTLTDERLTNATMLIGYIVLGILTGTIHAQDSPDCQRPFRCPYLSTVVHVLKVSKELLLKATQLERFNRQSTLQATYPRQSEL